MNTVRTSKCRQTRHASREDAVHAFRALQAVRRAPADPVFLECPRCAGWHLTARRNGPRIKQGERSESRQRGVADLGVGLVAMSLVTIAADLDTAARSSVDVEQYGPDLLDQAVSQAQKKLDVAADAIESIRTRT